MAEVEGVMLRKLITIASAFALIPALAAAPVDGQELTSRLAQCKSLGDSLQRLTCYDSIELPGTSKPIPARNDHQIVELDIFKVDKEAMTGKKVEVSGTIMQFGEMIMLTNGQMDSNPIMVDAENISREQRLTIVQRCDMGCRAIVQGEVGPVFFQTGILASSIAVR